MDSRQATIAYIQNQCRRYPELEPRDLLKALHQSVFGCGHFVTDEAVGLARLRAELAEAPSGGLDVEPLDGGFCRVHLSAVERTGLAPETLFRIFALSAQAPAGTPAELEEKLSVLLELAEDGQLPFAAGQMADAIGRWRRAGYPACHHSETFRAVYTPAYRVVRREFAWMLPLLAAIDRQLAVLRQFQQDRQLLLQLRPRTGRVLRRQGEDPEQRLRGQAGSFHGTQMDAAEAAVQGLHVRPAARGLRQLRPEPRQARRLVGDEVAAAEHALVQGFQQVLGLQFRIAPALALEICNCGLTSVQGAPRLSLHAVRVRRCCIIP